MANTVEVQTIVDGKSKLVVHIHLDSDGVSGELSNLLLIDKTTFNSPQFTKLQLLEIRSNLIGFTAELISNGVTPKHLWQCVDYEQHQCFEQIGGIPNNATTPDGNIHITTNGFTTAGDSGHIELTFRKHYN